MATNFPTTLDTLANPLAADVLGTAAGGIGVAAVMTNLNDAVEALEAKVGVDSSAVASSHDYLLRNLPVQESSFDMNGIKIILDADGDTSITADTDDQIDIEVAGADDFRITANTFTALSGSTIATDTIAETTAANGVSVDGLSIKDGNLNTGAWTSFVPTITAVTTPPTIGNGTLTGYYQQIGRTVSAYVSFVYGSTSAAGSGDWRFALPVACSANIPDLQCLGSANVIDTGTRAFMAYVRKVTSSTTTVEVEILSAAGTGTVLLDAGNNDPMTWATGDQVTFTIVYEAAS